MHRGLFENSTIWKVGAALLFAWFFVIIYAFGTYGNFRDLAASWPLLLLAELSAFAFVVAPLFQMMYTRRLMLRLRFLKSPLYKKLDVKHLRAFMPVLKENKDKLPDDQYVKHAVRWMRVWREVTWFCITALIAGIFWYGMTSA